VPVPILKRRDKDGVGGEQTCPGRYRGNLLNFFRQD